jgi:hypothetical protein
VSSKGQPLLGNASAAGPGPVLQNVAFHSARRDADAEAFHVAVINDIGLALRLKRINRPFRDSRHVATMSPPEKQVTAAFSNIIWQRVRYRKTNGGVQQLKIACGNGGCEICNQ